MNSDDNRRAPAAPHKPPVSVYVTFLCKPCGNKHPIQGSVRRRYRGLMTNVCRACGERLKKSLTP